MNFFSILANVSKALGAAVDAAVPVGIGSRTKFAVLACPLLGLAAPVVGLVPQAAPFAPLIPIAQKVLCGLAVPFAAAGVVRAKASAPQA